VLDEPTGELEDAPLRRIAAVPTPVPAGIAPQTGMLVHLRRRAALGMLTYLFWEREPPELATARLACRDIAVPLQIGNTTLHRDRHGQDVLRLPLGDNLDGFVAVVDPVALRPGQREPVLEVAERGVVLATYSIALAPIAREGEELRAPVPLRVFLDIDPGFPQMWHALGLADPFAGHDAFVMLRIAFAVAPIAFGLDKFFNVLTDWPQYLAGWVDDLMPGSAQDFMYAVGAIEIVAGLLVALRPRYGAPLVAAWLAGIIFTLLTGPGYYDVALRDFGLMLGALTLFRLALAYDKR